MQKITIFILLSTIIFLTASCEVETLSPFVRSEKLRQIKELEFTRDTGDGLLYHFLHSKDQQIREEAITALGRIGNPEAIPYLVALLGDGDDDIVKGAIYSLGLIGEKSADNDLAPLLYREPQITIACIEALGMLKSNLLRDRVEELGKRNNPQIIEALAYSIALAEIKESAVSLRQFAEISNDAAR